MKFTRPSKKQIHYFSRVLFWFFVGAIFAAFLTSSFAFIIFQKNYENLAYPGVSVGGINLAKMDREEIRGHFIRENEKVKEAKFTFTHEDKVATASAGDLEIGLDHDLIADQALSIGRSNDPVSNLSIILQSYFVGIDLSPSYRFSVKELEDTLSSLTSTINKLPVDALFQFENGKVLAFRPSSVGYEVNTEKVGDAVLVKTPAIFLDDSSKNIAIPLIVDTIEPEISTDEANDLGIRELIGSGTSLFRGSIENRVYNITLATSRLNGVLVPPDKIFSFNEALGDISSFTGYKQAFVIENGRTVLGDGGGVCQVSTTFFRALLNSGLPIVERTPHAYRVGYYEQDSGPGLDATIYVPSVDLKFKNDTGHHILIQTAIDPNDGRLTFFFYGTKDGRTVTVSDPVITNQTPPPPVQYQDDPTLPQGQLKQIDFEAWGANVYFTREVKKRGETIISEKFTSNYRPWRAVFLRGTK